jgi:glycosyltransferase involved in cell wall biosynthesis
MSQRILILATGHPLMTVGGSETAAFALFQAISAQGTHHVVFAARSSLSPLPGGMLAVHGRGDELLVDLPPVDHLTGHSRDPARLAARLQRLLDLVRPDVVHLHHYHHWGLEALHLIKRTGARLIFTFHEMMAICHNNGQMLKTTGALCREATPLHCAHCFPAIHPDAFYVRTKVIGQALRQVDVAISPSLFLAERLRTWGGLGDANLFVVDNPLAPSAFGLPGRSPVVPAPTGSRRVRFGFFGRLAPEKGVVPLLKAIIGLPPAVRSECHLTLHGTPATDTRHAEVVAALVSEAADCVHLAGPYAFGDVQALMDGCDWIVVPSLWWENSPVVIQEALAAGKPVLCSDLGGMAEKIEPGRTGWHVAPGSVPAWQDAIGQIVARRDLWPVVDSGEARARSDAALDAILSLYQG